MFSYGLPIALLAGILGCRDRQLKPPPPPPYTPASYSFNIDNKCKVTPEWQPMHLTDTVTWNPPDSTHTYTVGFHSYTPFGSTTTPPSSTAVPVSTQQTVTGGVRCYDPGHTSAATACYFPYDILQDGHKCGDPGIHVTQTGTVYNSSH